MKTFDKPRLIISYLFALFFPLVGIIIGIVLSAGKYDKRTQNHGTYLILISVFVGYGLFHAITR